MYAPDTLDVIVLVDVRAPFRLVLHCYHLRSSAFFQKASSHQFWPRACAVVVHELTRFPASSSNEVMKSATHKS